MKPTNAIRTALTCALCAWGFLSLLFIFAEAAPGATEAALLAGKAVAAASLLLCIAAARALNRKGLLINPDEPK